MYHIYLAIHSCVVDHFGSYVRFDGLNNLSKFCKEGRACVKGQLSDTNRWTSILRSTGHSWRLNVEGCETLKYHWCIPTSA